nr:adenylate/guanylate cyclase domain-containing protein [Lachnospiraceae bacterium]
MKKQKQTIKQLAVAAIVAAILTILAGAGALSWADNLMADTLFQRQEPTSGRIVVIGIDQAALQEYGPFQDWDRNIMA